MTISITIPSGDERAARAAAAFFMALTDDTPAACIAEPTPEPEPEIDYRLGQDGGFVPAHQVGAAPTPPAAPDDTPPEVDASGLPWDERIHAGSKARNKDGTWRLKPGVDRETLVPSVEAELRAVTPAGVFSAAPPPPPAGAPAVPTTYADFIASIAYLRTTHGMEVQDLLAACKQHGGADSLTVLADHPECIPAVWAELTA